MPFYRPLSGNAKPKSHIWDGSLCTLLWMQNRLEGQLAAFLRKRRGNLSYVRFARKLGLTKSTAHRLEVGGHSASLKMLQRILDRLHCRMRDIFPD